MKKRSSGTEDVFVLEMILHGRPEGAIRTAFPLMMDEYLPDAIAYMMDDPDVRKRIEAGIIYFYKDLLKHVDVPEIEQVSLSERRDFLFKIISGKRRYPQYIKTADGLRMIMVLPEPAIVNDALHMDTELEYIARQMINA